MIEILNAMKEDALDTVSCICDDARDRWETLGETSATLNGQQLVICAAACVTAGIAIGLMMRSKKKAEPKKDEKEDEEE